MYNKTKSNKKETSEMDAGAMGVLFAGIMGTLWWNKNSHKVEEFYFEYFEEIYLSLYGIGLIILFYIAYLLKKKNITAHIVEARERLGGRIYTKYSSFGELII